MTEEINDKLNFLPLLILMIPIIAIALLAVIVIKLGDKNKRKR